MGKFKSIFTRVVILILMLITIAIYINYNSDASYAKVANTYAFEVPNDHMYEINYLMDYYLRLLNNNEFDKAYDLLDEECKKEFFANNKEEFISKVKENIFNKDKINKTWEIENIGGEMYKGKAMYLYTASIFSENNDYYSNADITPDEIVNFYSPRFVNFSIIVDNPRSFKASFTVDRNLNEEFNKPDDVVNLMAPQNQGGLY